MIVDFFYGNEIHKRAFNNSHPVVFVFDDEKMIGFGRAICAYTMLLYFPFKLLGNTYTQSDGFTLRVCALIG